MAITLKGRPISPYPFGVFHTSLGSTLCTEFELKNDLSLGVLSSLVVAKMLLYCNINVLNLVRDTGFALALY